MKLNLISCILFLCANTVVFAQENILEVSQEDEFNIVKEYNFSFLNLDEELYQVNMISLSINEFYFGVNFRMEDELVTQKTYNLPDEVTYLDVNFNYTLKNFDFSLSVENVFNLNDTEFVIQPSVNEDLGFADTVNFSHESNFLISTCVTYNF